MSWVDDRFLRRDDVAASLVGDAGRVSRAPRPQGPESNFHELIQLMVEADLARLDPDQEYGPQLGLAECEQAG